MYVSPTVHVSDKLTRAILKWHRYDIETIEGALFSHRPPHAGPLDRGAHQFLSSQ